MKKKSSTPKPKAAPKAKDKPKKESLVEKLNHEDSLFGELLVEQHQVINTVKKNKKKS